MYTQYCCVSGVYPTCVQMPLDRVGRQRRTGYLAIGSAIGNFPGFRGVVDPPLQHVAARDLPEWTTGWPAKAASACRWVARAARSASFHLRPSGDCSAGRYDWTERLSGLAACSLLSFPRCHSMAAMGVSASGHWVGCSALPVCGPGGPPINPHRHGVKMRLQATLVASVIKSRGSGAIAAAYSVHPTKDLAAAMAFRFGRGAPPHGRSRHQSRSGARPACRRRFMIGMMGMGVPNQCLDSYNLPARMDGGPKKPLTKSTRYHDVAFPTQLSARASWADNLVQDIFVRHAQGCKF